MNHPFFDIESDPMSEGKPFANVMLLCRARRLHHLLH